MDNNNNSKSLDVSINPPISAYLFVQAMTIINLSQILNRIFLYRDHLQPIIVFVVGLVHS